VPGQGALGKVCFLKKKEKKKSLPSVGPGALGKVMFFFKKEKNFAECRARGTRQSIFIEKRKKNYAECRAWGTRQSKKIKKICRVLGGHSAK
jgi:hypothetical protein